MKNVWISAGIFLAVFRSGKVIDKKLFAQQNTTKTNKMSFHDDSKSTAKRRSRGFHSTLKSVSSAIAAFSLFANTFPSGFLYQHFYVSEAEAGKLAD